MIQAVIFDMDGLLIDSEPLWSLAEIKVFGSVGVPLTAVMTTQTMGLRADEVVSYWHHRYPWTKSSQKDVAEALINEMVHVLSTKEIALPGVHEAIKVAKTAGLPMAIASSSPRRLINAAIKNLGIADKLTTIESAEHEVFGKPHPGVYIKAAQKLGVAPEHCLAFEDSPNGILSAKSAKMKCIAVPDDSMRASPMMGIADRVLDSLLDFTPALLQELSA